MFITLVRQFGAQFTSYTAADRHDESIPVQKRHGYVEFLSGDNKAKTLQAMQMVLDLAGDGSDMSKQIFAPTGTFGSYSSGAFAMNAVLFTICSTGGLSYNINANQEFRVAPVPYNTADKKFVISQGANITVFNQGYIGSEDGKSYTAEQMADMCFEAIVKMTTGDNQAKFASLTGYFPASKSATESQVYQDFLKGTETDPIKRAYRDGARINSSEYMTAEKGWTKFVDPGFLGSSEIRSTVNTLITSLITNHTKAGFDLDSFMTTAYNDSFADYIRK
jgi:ABC-type glycerol-3-phosphate transport system substrate-binding protein